MNTILFQQSESLNFSTKFQTSSTNAPIIQENKPTSTNNQQLLTSNVDFHVELSLSAQMRMKMDETPPPPAQEQTLSEFDPMMNPELRKTMSLLELFSPETRENFLSNLSKLHGELGDNQSEYSESMSMFYEKIQRGVISQTESAGHSEIGQLQEVQVRFEFWAEDSTRVVTKFTVEEADPLVLDLDGDGIELSSMENGVEFDINGDGRLEKTGFVAGDDGLLVMDRNGNGKIDNGKELFGDQNGAKDGFQELSRFDSDDNGVINKNDKAWKSMLIWQDINENGESEANELNHVSEHGITSLSLSDLQINEKNEGNRITSWAPYTHESGQGSMADAWFRYRPLA